MSSEAVTYCDYYHILPTTEHTRELVWSCCGGPYVERPYGHYADCTSRDQRSELTKPSRNRIVWQ